MKVTVHRKQRLRDWGPRYRIKVDGETVGKVFSGRNISFEVQPGTHTIQCQVELFSKSPLVEFTVGDEPVDFECEPRLGTFASALENRTDGDQHILLRQIA